MTEQWLEGAGFTLVASQYWPYDNASYWPLEAYLSSVMKLAGMTEQWHD
jgi:hypothetical protein